MLSFKAIEFEVESDVHDDEKTRRHERFIFVKTLLRWYHHERKHIFPNSIVSSMQSSTFDMGVLDLIRSIWDSIFSDGPAVYRFTYRFQDEKKRQANMLIEESVRRFYDDLNATGVAFV